MYHKRCSEGWCTNLNGYYYDYWSDNHFLESQKEKNSCILNEVRGLSVDETYQSKLNKLPEEDGIMYEMVNFSKYAINGLYEIYKNFSGNLKNFY